jgi:hypothetical protein
MIPILEVGWLPGARMALTPFGPEFFIENWLLKELTPYSYPEQHAKIVGVGASILIECKLKGRSAFQIESGGKSKRFLPGSSLHAAPLTRLYYSLVF